MIKKLDMKVCVCGWHYYQPFYSVLSKLKDKAVVVSNKSEYPSFVKNNIVIRCNTGLEYGAYNHYVKNIWDKESPVLFLHDDCHVNEKFFYNVAKTSYDQAFVYHDRYEAQRNLGHGRAIYCSAQFLNAINEIRFENEESVNNLKWFIEDSLKTGLKVNKAIYFEDIEFAYRGIFSGGPRSKASK